MCHQGGNRAAATKRSFGSRAQEVAPTHLATQPAGSGPRGGGEDGSEESTYEGLKDAERLREAPAPFP